MKYLLLVLAILILTANVSYAQIYAAIDKESGIVQGTVDVNPDSIGEWAKTYTMKQVDESYRGLKGEEVKFEKGKIRKATKEEIADAEAAKPKPDTLSQSDIKKLKALIK